MPDLPEVTMKLRKNDPSQPGASALAASEMIAWAEFLEQTDATEARIHELMELGWLQPVGRAAHSPLFRRVDIYRTRKLSRLCEDFEMPCVAGTIIVDLLERIATLETRLNELERR
jgi:chaperone modulatory protein CbpM